jgi:predicted transcriptional regulator
MLMKPLRGMRPQDIAILLKIVSLGKKAWKTTDLASQLYISQSEISQSLHRNWSAGLLDESKRNVHKRSLVEFLIHGVKYVYPQKPGPMVRGTPTAHSAAPLSSMIQSRNDAYVWPDEEGSLRGEMIEPLYPNIPKAAKADQAFYELLALVDAIRVGKSREYRIAVDELQKRIMAQ